MPNGTTERPDPTLVSGRIILALSPRVMRQVRKRARRGQEFHDLRELARALRLDVEPVLAAHPDIPTRRLIDSASTQELFDLEATAKRNGWPPRRSLNSYWILDTRAYPDEQEQILARMLDPTALQSLEHVVARNVQRTRGRSRQLTNAMGLGKHTLGSAEWELSEPRRSIVSSPTVYLDQPYLGPPPVGIGAEEAWIRGYEGSGIAFVDLESQWNFEHELLREKTKGDAALRYNHNGPANLPAHGTFVLGIVAAAHTGAGTRGIAPGVTVSAVSRRRCPTANGKTRCSADRALDNWDVAGAIIAAVKELRWGDVLLIEVETAEKQYPVEVVPHCFDAIRVAVGHGIVVIEAGGNGGRRVDRWLPPRALWHGSFGVRRDDSGAILVGACEPGLTEIVVQKGGHRRSGHSAALSSSFGSRVDCYAWGRAVATTGPHTHSYEQDFNGTSAAAAIIAGAAILVQQMHLRATGERLAPWEMRELLGDARLGTECAWDVEQDPPRVIGAMPNLVAIADLIEQLSPDDVPPIWSRTRESYVSMILKGARRAKSPRRSGRGRLRQRLARVMRRGNRD